MKARRTRRRGAALVEAAVVMPVVVIFYGIMVFVFREYDLKGSLLAASRHKAFYGALHGCSRAADTEADRVGFTSVPGLGEARRGLPARVLEAGALTTFVQTHGMKAMALSKGVAENAPLSNVLRSRGLEASSMVYCVPRAAGQAGRSLGSEVSSLSHSESVSFARAAVSDLIAAIIGVLT